MQAVEESRLPLTTFSDEETLFRESVADFAKAQLGGNICLGLMILGHPRIINPKQMFPPEIGVHFSTKFGIL